MPPIPVGAAPSRCGADETTPLGLLRPGPPATAPSTTRGLLRPTVVANSSHLRAPQRLSGSRCRPAVLDREEQRGGCDRLGANRPVPDGAESRRLAAGVGHVGRRLALARRRVRRVHRVRRAVALQGPRDRGRPAGVHARPASRVRCRPHLGDRQHHAQADERPQEPGPFEAAALGRLLLLPRALDHRHRDRGGHRRRREGGLRGGLQRPLRDSSSSAASSERSCRPPSSTSSRR